MHTRVKIEGMSCQHCVTAVFTSLAGVDGIAQADVSIGTALVEHDGTVTLERLAEAIGLAGYRVAGEVRRGLPIL